MCAGNATLTRFIGSVGVAYIARPAGDGRVCHGIHSTTSSHERSARARSRALPVCAIVEQSAAPAALGGPHKAVWSLRSFYRRKYRLAWSSLSL
eukprot:5700222-Prymnesium_polylepis.1